MEMYNRYLMRPSGEKKHQPKSLSEGLVFGTFDFMKSINALPTGWETSSEADKNAFMDELSSHLSRIYADYATSPV